MKGIGFMVGRPAAGEAGSAAAADSRAPQRESHSATSVAKAESSQAVKASPLMQAAPSNAVTLLSRLPPASHRIWRYAAFAVVALIGILMIVAYFPSSSSKPPSPASVVGGSPASVVGGAPAPVNAAVPTDEGDIGQTGPHNAVAPSGGDTNGDSGDVGQGNGH
jgi:hypothetical protein